MTFAFVADHADKWPVAWMCKALEVSVSGYYAWKGLPFSKYVENHGGAHWHFVLYYNKPLR